jgi:hypothetical protein
MFRRKVHQRPPTGLRGLSISQPQIEHTMMKQRIAQTEGMLEFVCQRESLARTFARVPENRSSQNQRRDVERNHAWCCRVETHAWTFGIECRNRTNVPTG